MSVALWLWHFWQYRYRDDVGWCALTVVRVAALRREGSRTGQRYGDGVTHLIVGPGHVAVGRAPFSNQRYRSPETSRRAARSLPLIEMVGVAGAPTLMVVDADQSPSHSPSLHFTR